MLAFVSTKDRTMRSVGCAVLACVVAAALLQGFQSHPCLSNTPPGTQHARHSANPSPEQFAAARDAMLALAAELPPKSGQAVYLIGYVSKIN